MSMAALAQRLNSGGFHVYCVGSRVWADLPGGGAVGPVLQPYPQASERLIPSPATPHRTAGELPQSPALQMQPWRHQLESPPLA